MSEYQKFLEHCQELEAAKQSKDPIDRMWLQSHRDAAQSFGLHPDAVAASPVSF